MRKPITPTKPSTPTTIPMIKGRFLFVVPADFIEEFVELPGGADPFGLIAEPGPEGSTYLTP